MSSFLTRPSSIFVAKALVTFCFWFSGISKLLDWKHGISVMQFFHLTPPVLFYVGTVFVQIVGSGLILWTRFAWIGALALAVFTLGTIPVAYDFWNKDGWSYGAAISGATEHISLLGALLSVVILRAFEDRRIRV
jgi:transmembrane protein